MFYAAYIDRVGSDYVGQWAAATGRGYCRVIRWCADEGDAVAVVRDLNERATSSCAPPR